MGRSTQLILAGLAVAGLVAAPAAAEQRGFSITNFERIIVNGPFTVVVETGRGTSARAEGEYHAIDGISLNVTGRTLNVRRNVSGGWGSYPGEGEEGGAILYLSTPRVSHANMIGNGDLSIDRLDGQQVGARLGGNGRIAIGAVDSESVVLDIAGSGVIEASGAADALRVNVQGPGTMAAPGLHAESAQLRLTGPGLIEVSAEREADISASGSGNIIVHGPAACTDHSAGAGQVICEGSLGRR